MANPPRRTLFSFPTVPRLAAALIYGGLTAFVFGSIYGYTNFRASQMTNLLRVYAEWETHIPLVQWMVFPYISQDLLLVLPIFVFRETTKIRDYCFTLIVGALVAGSIFYFFPGALGFARASGPGHLPIFDRIYAIDYPHNLFPSLHVAYASISVAFLRRESSSKTFHVFLWSWLILIAASVVLTHQHHLFDVVSGALLAAILIRGPNSFLKSAQPQFNDRVSGTKKLLQP
jgi:membrane-associated phospholipid phosphatase